MFVNDGFTYFVYRKGVFAFRAVPNSHTINVYIVKENDYNGEQTFKELTCFTRENLLTDVKQFKQECEEIYSFVKDDYEHGWY